MRPLPFARGRVTRADPGADRDLGQASRAKFLRDPRKRQFQVAPDVVRQRLEGRDVDDLRFVRQFRVQPLADKPVDGGEERGQRLARAGRRGKQHVPSGRDGRPCLRLRRRRRREGAVEPGPDDGMERRNCMHARISYGHCGISRNRERPSGPQPGVSPPVVKLAALCIFAGAKICHKLLRRWRQFLSTRAESGLHHAERDPGEFC